MDKIINKRFDEVFDLSLGRTPSRGVGAYWGGSHTWVSIADMSCGKYISESKEYITDKALSDTGIPVVKKGTVIMSFKLSIGKVCIADTDLYTNEAIMAFVPKPQYKILPEFLYYYLMCYEWNNSNEVVLGFTLNKKTISQSIVSIPSSLAEQERIVEILDREFERIDALKTNAEQNLQYAKALFQSALKKELQPKEGWVTASLNDLYDVRDGTHDSPKYTQQGYPFVTSKNLKDGKIDMSDVKYISKEDYDKINERSKVDVGDILFAMIGSNLGHPALVVDEPNYAIKNVALFKVPSSQSSRLLLYLLSSDLIMDKINKEKSGSSQPFVSLKYLRTFKVSIPMEYEQQEELALRIERLDRISKRLQSKYINIIALCDDMKQALLRKAFNGEL